MYSIILSIAAILISVSPIDLSIHPNPDVISKDFVIESPAILAESDPLANTAKNAAPPTAMLPIASILKFIHLVQIEFMKKASTVLLIEVCILLRNSGPNLAALIVDKPSSVSPNSAKIGDFATDSNLLVSLAAC